MVDNHDCYRYRFAMSVGRRRRRHAGKAGGVGGAVAAMCFISATSGANDGIPVNGQPNYQERAVLTLTNAVRMAPSQYRDGYLPAGNGGILTGPAVGPLYWNAQLNVAARNHAVDMATQNYFSHTSLNGTTWIQRIAQAGYGGSPIGENIAAGYVTPLDVMTGWLLSQGHRDNIMNANSRELGIGYAYSALSTYGRYWVQDMGARSFAVTSPIVCGSHVFPSTGIIRFLLNVDDPATQYSPPQSVKVVVNVTPYVMNLHLGVADRGTYEKTIPTGSGCRSYHFELVSAAGTVWRYPTTGEYRSYGESGCTQDYHAAPAGIPGDVTGNGVVNMDDLTAVIAAWGMCPSPPAACPADQSPFPQGNGVVNIDDLMTVINNWSQAS